MPLGFDKLKNIIKNGRRDDFGSADNPGLLTVFDGAKEPAVIDLLAFGKDEITFGRGEGSDIRLKSPYVSRQHGCFKRSEHGFIIENNPNSTNGLLFDGNSIENKRLKNGDIIRIDDSVEETADGVAFLFGGDTASAEFDLLSKAEPAQTGAEHDVFISYSSDEKKTADKIYDTLTKNGIVCWIDYRNIRAGHKYTTEIMRGIKNCTVFLLLFSEKSNGSQYCYNETDRAVAHKKWIIPYLLTETKMTEDFEFLLSTSQWINGILDKDYAQLVTEIKHILANKKNR